MQTTEAPVQPAPVKTLSDDVLIDEMREQLTWARNENPGYSRERFMEVLTELKARKLVDLSAHADTLAQ